MNCKNAQSLLSAYIDEELTGREMLELRTHLSDCADCSEELRCVEAVKRILGGTAVPDPSADFEERLVTAVLSAARPEAEQRRVSLMALTGIAAASMLGTLLILNGMRREAPTVSEQRNSLPYELMQRDAAFGASSDPLIASPVLSHR